MKINETISGILTRLTEFAVLCLPCFVYQLMMNYTGLSNNFMCRKGTAGKDCHYFCQLRTREGCRKAKYSKIVDYVLHKEKSFNANTFFSPLA